MRKVFVAMLAMTIFTAIGVPIPGTAQVTQKPAAEQKPAKSKSLKATGTIISVDTAAKTFVCKWQTNDWVYKVTDKTVFRAKGKTADFADLKLNSRVSMTFHMDGKQRVADLVTIQQ